MLYAVPFKTPRGVQMYILKLKNDLSFIFLTFLNSNIPNRSTFVCPYCGARNLDQQELVKHCMENHRNDPNKVVSFNYLMD